MSTYVLDASVAHSAQLYLEFTDELFAPEIIDLEVANVLRKSVIRHDRSPQEAGELFAAWAENDVQRISHSRYLDTIWALRHNITPYDAAYVALAMHLQVALITADRRLAVAAAPYCEVVTID
ncbi:hypothetical protein BH09ACT5_BH09ACT5_07090 [soil metagenome]